ncbi:type 1 glutamine amidotransferase [Mechercharimyces sp. CAU 1602]|uniref:type 1 glutamine amidotransferase n=1 Tax=Mechercharimyces sp. CAU 1602 TaxID=2973933 RepID=UPI00216379F9|nr:type 1 glutamine amidotransferase [Mechercharimyces sp. CAU 1602]MCS1351839.1 type 1 glutamine amidotransferase [Mechercharimyces sp. CAU 1602]
MNPRSTRIHIIQHVDFEGPAAISQWASSRKYTLSSTKLYSGEYLPSLSTVDMIVIMGGPMNVYEDEQYPWLVQEKEWLKEAIQQQKLILGICLGAQLLAHTLGARITPGVQKEIGWYPITLTKAGLSDPIVGLLPPEMTVFHWHGDVAAVPVGATCLATSAACPNQIFRYGKHAFGLQFHFEMTTSSLHSMTNHCADELNSSGTYISDEQAIHQGGNLHLSSNQHWLYQLLDGIMSQRITV